MHDPALTQNFESYFAVDVVDVDYNITVVVALPQLLLLNSETKIDDSFI